jgi:hypothetical protein
MPESDDDRDLGRAGECILKHWVNENVSMYVDYARVGLFRP